MIEATDRQWLRAQRYLAGGQLDAAQVKLESLLQRDPAHIPTHIMLGQVAWNQDRLRDATRHALDAAQLLTATSQAQQIIDVTATLLQVGEIVKARECLEHPALSAIQDGAMLVRLGLLRQMLGEHPEALELLDRAKAAGMDAPDFHFYRGVELTFNGRMDDARCELETCLEQAPMFGRAALALSRLHKQTPEKNHLDALAQRIHDVGAQIRGREDHAALEFACYKELEDLGRYDEAWEALVRGNALMYAQRAYDQAYDRNLLARLVELCTPQFLQPEKVVHSGPQPIFIIGMMRSGTTLLDRMLSNHSRVISAGERDAFAIQMRWMADHRFSLDDTMLQRLSSVDFAKLGRRYLHQTQWIAAGESHFIDKLPRNWMVAGLIRRALPQARILHLVRDPIAVCFSNFRALFSDRYPFTYNLDALAAYHQQYRRVMAHWHAAMPGQILDVAYTDLAANPESTLRKVLDFCNLEWEPACADPSNNKSAVATLSMTQVREGAHTRFIDEWRNYERQLAPLRQALEA